MSNSNDSGENQSLTEQDPTSKDRASEQPLLTGPKRQHYLPRFYLEGFAKEGTLAVYDQRGQALHLTGIVDV